MNGMPEKMPKRTVIARYDGIVRIITDTAVCVVYVGDEDCLTLADCEKKALAMGWDHENDGPVVVIAEQETSGAVYKYGNHVFKGKRGLWDKVGETVGYA